MRYQKWIVPLCGLAVACASPHTNKESVAPPATFGAKNLIQKDLEEKAEQRKAAAVLPPATQSPEQIRIALWDIEARQRKGEAGKVLNDYADQFDSSKTLEARFLAAASIFDEETRWQSFKAIRDDQPKFYWAHIAIANIYASWKVPDHCEQEIALAQESMDLPYTHTVLGNLYRNMSQSDQAIREYQTALRGDPKDADARTGLALSRRETGLMDGFESELKQALRDMPTHFEAAQALALFYDDKQQTVEARKTWELVEKLNPRSRTAQLALARLRGDQDPAGAVVAYEQASKISPLTHAELQSLSKLYRQVMRTDDEIKTLQTLAKQDPKDMVPLKRLVEIYELKNDAANVESAYKNVLAVDPKDGASQYGLGKAAEKKLQLRDAYDLYKQAFENKEERARGELKRIESECMLPERPWSGRDLTFYYQSISNGLESLYTKRLVDDPRLKGTMKIGIESDGLGKVVAVTIKENTLKDGCFDVIGYYGVLNSAIPKLKATDPKKFTFTFELPPVKK